jgi:hypothetical protein
MNRKYGLTLSLLFAIATSISAQSPVPPAKSGIAQASAPIISWQQYLQYRFFANVIMDRFQQGDIATAARVAHIMELSWDNESERLTDQNRDVWRRLDAAQDEFIEPVKSGYLTTNPRAPDPVRVANAYKEYLAVLAKEANISDEQAAKLNGEQ